MLQYILFAKECLSENDPLKDPQINSEKMHIRLEQPSKNIKTKLPNDEEIRR